MRTDVARDGQDGVTISTTAGLRQHERDQEATYLQTLRGLFEEFSSTSDRPHVSFLAALFDKQISAEEAHLYGDGAGQATVVSLAGPAGQETASRIEDYGKNLISLIPKTTQLGDTHSYAQFSVNPPTGRTGTIHIMQFCPWLEPPLGLDWEPVRVLVADILGGKAMRDRLKVVAAPKGPFTPSPTMFGWAPDGEGAVAVKFFALASIAYCIVAAQMAVPPSLLAWLHQLSAISPHFDIPLKFCSRKAGLSRLLQFYMNYMCVSTLASRTTTPTSRPTTYTSTS